MEGVLPLAHSLDTLGFFTHTPADMLSLWETLGKPRGREEKFALGFVEFDQGLEPAMSAAFRNTMALLRRHGVALQPLRIAPLLDKLAEECMVVMKYEGARFHEQRYKEHGARLQDLANLVREGLEISERRYRDALGVIADGRAQIGETYKTTPVILVPAATGPAPRGLGSTGNSRMNRPWTALGTPAISIPMPVPSGLPLGLQLTAAHGEDARLLHTAVRVARMLDTPA
jgi:Asp-tRNA(Asn)/Glu-tRNA(Gln) amidotransferase A subunit family amidase